MKIGSMYSFATSENTMGFQDAPVTRKPASLNPYEAVKKPPDMIRNLSSGLGRAKLAGYVRSNPSVNSTTFFGATPLQDAWKADPDTNGFVKGWNYNFRQVLYTIKESRSTLGLVYHSQWPKFVTYGDDAKIFLYDEESRVQERVLTSSKKPNTQDGHTSKVSAACFHPRNMYELVTAGIDRTIYFWDVRQPHATRHIPGVYMVGEGLDINTKGTQILACSLQKENALQIFDYSNAKLVGKMNAPDAIGQLHTGKFASKSFAVVGGNEPNGVYVVDYTTFESVAHVEGLPSTVYGLDVGPKKELDPKKMPTEFSSIPCCAAVSGNKLYQIDFY